MSQHRLPHNAFDAYRAHLFVTGYAPSTARIYTSAVRTYARAVEDLWDATILNAYFVRLSPAHAKLFRGAWRRFRSFALARWPDVPCLPDLPRRRQGGDTSPVDNGQEIAPGPGVVPLKGQRTRKAPTRAPVLPDAILWAVDQITSMGASTRDLAGFHWRENPPIPQRILFLFCAWSQQGAIPGPTDPILAREPGSKLGYPAKRMGSLLLDYRKRCREAGRALGQPPLNGPRTLAQALEHLEREQAATGAAQEVWFTLPPESAPDEVPLPGPLPSSVPSSSPVE